MTFSRIIIRFLQPFTTGFKITIVRLVSGGTTTNTWDFVAARANPFEVTSGLTAIDTATNFEAAVALDFPTGFQTSVLADTVTIESETEGENFIGFSALNASDVLLLPNVAFITTFENFEPVVNVSNIDLALENSSSVIAPSL